MIINDFLEENISLLKMSASINLSFEKEDDKEHWRHRYDADFGKIGR